VTCRRCGSGVAASSQRGRFAIVVIAVVASIAGPVVAAVGELVHILLSPSQSSVAWQPWAL